MSKKECAAFARRGGECGAVVVRVTGGWSVTRKGGVGEAITLGYAPVALRAARTARMAGSPVFLSCSVGPRGKHRPSTGSLSRSWAISQGI